MTETEAARQLESIVRALASAGKSLRLYPATSPIPVQAVDTVIELLKEYFRENQVLALRVGREGFEHFGSPVAAGAVGVSDLASSLQEHGVAELDVLAQVTSKDIIALLAAAMRDAEEVRSEGGMAAVLLAEGSESIRVTDVHLTVQEDVLLEHEGDVDEFLRRLSEDPEKLAAWMAAASAGDPAAFSEGLEELAAVAGGGGIGRLVETMAAAFMQQDRDGKDAMIGLALEPGTVQDLTGGMFGHLASADIADSIAGGLFGKNMLSLSNALTHLPLEDRIRQVYSEVQEQLAGLGHSDKEGQFLEHMMDVRMRTEPETALLDSEASYKQAAAAAELNAEELDAARQNTAAQTSETGASGVRTMLALLDQQTNHELYTETLANLSTMVPTLVQEGDVDLAQRIVLELNRRSLNPRPPWPDLPAQIDQALSDALSEQTMRALVDAVVENPDLAGASKDLARHGNDSALQALAMQAVSHKDAGLAAAEEILGRKLLEIIAVAAPNAQWYQIGAIVQRLASENDPRYTGIIQTALARHDEQSRREAASGVAASGSRTAAGFLSALTRDPSAEVAIVAVRALAKNRVPGGAELLAKRLGELDADGKDFTLAREVIGALARMPEPAATNALKKMAGRKSLMKRGHFAEVQELVRQALQLQSESGGTQ